MLGGEEIKERKEGKEGKESYLARIFSVGRVLPRSRWWLGLAWLGLAMYLTS